MKHKIKGKNTVSSWSQSSGFASYVNVAIDDVKKQYLWCINPDSTIWYAFVNPNSNNNTNSLFWSKIDGKGKKVISNTNCNGTQLLWKIGLDDTVKHSRYTRNFRKLSDWKTATYKNDSGDDVPLKATDIAVHLSDTAIQTLYVVNNSDIMQLKFDSNNKK